MIRAANVSDIHKVLELAKKMHPHSSYRHIPIDEGKFKKLFAVMVCSKQAWVWVAEYDDKITAVLMGMKDEVFFSRKKAVTDVLFLSLKGGGYLARRFVKWAKSDPAVIDIRVGLTSGMKSAERTGLAYEKLGLKNVGAIYFADVSEGVDNE